MIKFRALSQTEVNKISKILDEHHLQYNVSLDENIIDSNEESIRYDLRHLNSPSISTHVLVIEVEDDFWEKASEQIRLRLEAFGIVEIKDDGENPIVFDNEDPEQIRGVLNDGNKRLIGVHFFFYFIVIGVLTYLIRFLFS